MSSRLARLNGVSTVRLLFGNYGQSALTPDQVFDLGARADSPDAQAIVLSCTDMRAVEIIEPLQDTLGKPVVCSNGALMQWAKKQIDC
ncbi:MAG: hypothetical protein GKR95_16035 [Gammaproteobacteria bacterium]|nr:hypothetical protein [Gammaproteobacteria bacterium]